MKLSVCKLNYRSLRKGKLTDFANGIIAGLYKNSLVFAAPPIAADDFVVVATNYNLAYKDYLTFGKTKKTAYQEAVLKLVGVLDTLALYVNSVANGDASKIELAGFEPTAQGSQASPPLDQIITIDITPSKVKGQVIIETPAIVCKNFTGYGLNLKIGEPYELNTNNRLL